MYMKTLYLYCGSLIYSGGGYTCPYVCIRHGGVPVHMCVCIRHMGHGEWSTTNRQEWTVVNNTRTGVDSVGPDASCQRLTVSLSSVKMDEVTIVAIDFNVVMSDCPVVTPSTGGLVQGSHSLVLRTIFNSYIK